MAECKPENTHSNAHVYQLGLVWITFQPEHTATLIKTFIRFQKVDFSSLTSDVRARSERAQLGLSVQAYACPYRSQPGKRHSPMCPCDPMRRGPARQYTRETNKASPAPTPAQHNTHEHASERHLTHFHYRQAQYCCVVFAKELTQIPTAGGVLVFSRQLRPSGQLACVYVRT